MMASLSAKAADQVVTFLGEEAMKSVAVALMLLTLAYYCEVDIFFSCRINKDKVVYINKNEISTGIFTYKMKTNKEWENIFDNDGLGGINVKTFCATDGKKSVAILYGEFGGNYLKGVAIGAEGRIRFAEKIWPKYIFYKNNGFGLVFEEKGRWDSAGMYVIYSKEKDRAGIHYGSNKIRRHGLIEVK